MRKRVRPHFEDDLLLDKNHEKLLRLVQLGDENLDNFSVDQARRFRNVDPRCRISEPIRYKQEDELLDERNLNVPETLGMSTETEKAQVLENVKSEPLDFDTGGMNECTNKRIRSEKSNTPVPVKNAVSIDNVKLETPDSDSGGNQVISERCSKRSCLEVSSTPQMLKSSLVKKNKKFKRTSRRFLKKEKMKINTPNKSACVSAKEKSGKKNKRKTVNVKAAHAVPGRSTVLFSKQKGSQVLHSSQNRRNPEASSIHMDETYEAFLNNAVVSGDQMIYTPKNGTRHIYEEDMQCSSDSEQTILDNNRRDGYGPSYVKTKAASNKSLRKDVMKRKMSCHTNYQNTSSDADLNEQDSQQHEEYGASYVKTKAATLRKHMMKKKISCPKNYQDTSLDSDLNEQDSQQHDEFLSLNVSESYELFKTFIEVNGKSLIYIRSNGERKMYEEVQTTSDVGINAETNAMHKDPLDSFHTMDTDTGHSIKSHNQFREGLMEDLGRPYNQDEHFMLLEDACRQGPSNSEIDLINGMGSCQTPTEYGNTYLEVYKDLAEKINAADGDCSRKLNLLRGLFYWLENKSEEGSFIPWKDKRYLKALQQPEGNRGHSIY